MSTLALRRFLTGSAHIGAFAALVVAGTTPLPAQTLPAGAYAPYTSLAAFQVPTYTCRYGSNSLNTLADGATTIPFPFVTGTCPSGLSANPFAAGTLHGAVVTGGQIVANAPFSITLANGALPTGFGADFHVIGGTDAIYITLLANGVSRGTWAAVVGPTTQFLGALTFDNSHADTILIGTTGGSAFVVDNLIVAAPEPATVVLTLTGLCAVAFVGRRRRAA